MNKVWETWKLIPQSIQLMLVAVSVFFVTNIVSGWQSKSVIEGYIEKYKQYQAEAAQTTKMLDSVKKVINQKDEEIVMHINEASEANAAYERAISTLPSPKVVVELKTRIDSLKKVANDSVVLARTVIPVQDTLIKAQDSTIKVYKVSLLAKDNENIALRKVNTGLMYENGTLKTALDSARTTIINLPKPPSDPDKWFFGLIKKPTRTQSIIVGFVGGSLATLYLTRGK